MLMKYLHVTFIVLVLGILTIAEHLNHDLILHWAWLPGGNREPAPYSLQEHVNDILAWGVAGTPCPED